MHDVESLYREHLTDADRRLVERAAGGEPTAVVPWLGSADAEAAVLGAAADPFVLASPFLVFATAVHRVAAHLDEVSFVHEWVGPRQRVPVFDVVPMRELLADPLRRFFLVELLASYTKVASGSTWVRTRRGFRRRRFSELDPVRLATLLDAVPPSERAGVYRRLGDVCLFLTGVFPDHTAVRGLGPVDAARLRRAAGLATADPPGERSTGGVELLEELGARWYRRAVEAVPGPPTGTMGVVSDVADRFATARRVLDVVTDRYLFGRRERWFGPG